MPVLPPYEVPEADADLLDVGFVETVERRFNALLYRSFIACAKCGQLYFPRRLMPSQAPIDSLRFCPKHNKKR